MAFGRLRIDEIETSTQTVNVDALVGITADGDKGDITVSGSGTVWTIDDGAVDTAALGGDITAAGKALLDDADAATQRTTLGAEAAGTAASTISTHEAAADPHPGYALESDLGGAALLDVGITTGTVAAGDDSRFIPAGGTTGQALLKSSGTDYDASWSDLPARTTSAAGVLPATSYAAITYAATVNLDLAALDGQYRTISLTGDLTLTTSNLATGRTAVIRIIADASQRTLTFPADWKFLGTKPANIAASKTGVLSLTFFGTADSDCVAAWGVQG